MAYRRSFGLRAEPPQPESPVWKCETATGARRKRWGEVVAVGGGRPCPGGGVTDGNGLMAFIDNLVPPPVLIHLSSHSHSLFSVRLEHVRTTLSAISRASWPLSAPTTDAAALASSASAFWCRLKLSAAAGRISGGGRGINSLKRCWWSLV